MADPLLYTPGTDRAHVGAPGKSGFRNATLVLSRVENHVVYLQEEVRRIDAERPFFQRMDPYRGEFDSWRDFVRIGVGTWHTLEAVNRIVRRKRGLGSVYPEADLAFWEAFGKPYV